METRPYLSRFNGAEELLAGTAQNAIEWAVKSFGDRVCLLASMQDAVLIDLVMRVDRSVPVVFLDNGYHFAETHDTRRRIERRYGIEVEVVGPFAEPRNDVVAGECCDAKVGLLELALAGHDAWMSGIRRSENPARSQTPLVGTDRRGMTKISPVAQWDDRDTAEYITARSIITNPLREQGYASIGCEPCTTKSLGDDGRSGRWAGSARTECGLHL